MEASASPIWFLVASAPSSLGKNFSQSSFAAVQHLLQETSLHELQLIWVGIFLLMDHSSVSFPWFHGRLKDRSSAQAWGPPWTAEGILLHC